MPILKDEFLGKKFFITAAKDLGYSSEVIQALKQAKNSDECSRIMTTERKRAIKREEMRDKLWRSRPN